MGTKPHWREGKIEVTGTLVPDDSGSDEALHRMCGEFGRRWEQARAAVAIGLPIPPLGDETGARRAIAHAAGHYGAMAARKPEACPDHDAIWALQRFRIPSDYVKRDGTAWLVADAFVTAEGIDAAAWFRSVEIARDGAAWTFRAWTFPKPARKPREPGRWAQAKAAQQQALAAEWLALFGDAPLTPEALVQAAGYIRQRSRPKS